MTNNELIAEFEQLKKNAIGQYITRKGATSSGELEYDISWDWLMPACKKWDGLVFLKGDGAMREQMRLCDELDNAVSCYDIEPAFRQLVKNIKWYNSQSPQAV